MGRGQGMHEWSKMVKGKEKERTTRIWRRSMNGKSSLNIYKMKEKWGRPAYWDCRSGARELFKVRTGGFIERNKEKNTDCPMCGQGKDSQYHMILECTKSRGKWDQIRGSRRVREAIATQRETSERTVALILGICAEPKGLEGWEEIAHVAKEVMEVRARTEKAGEGVGVGR